MVMGKKNGMIWIDWVAILLLLVGGLNWGFVGFLNFNLVSWLLGAGTFWSRAVFSLVGLSALYSIWSLAKVLDR